MDVITRHRIEVSVRAMPRSPLKVGAARTSAYALSWLVVALMGVESLLGLIVEGLYPEAPWAVAALRANDLVTLVLVAPVLAAALVQTQRHRSARWALLWLGALTYSVYNFAYYVFGTAFNDVFLLHVATFTLSLIALVAVVASLDIAAVTPRQPDPMPSRVVAGFMMLVGLAMAGAWSWFSLRFAVTGELPADVMPPGAIHLVYALDLSLLAPAFFLGGLLLWRAVPWGHAMGVAVSAFGAAYLTVLYTVGGFQANAGIEGKTWADPTVPLLAAACAAAAAVLLRRHRRS